MWVLFSVAAVSSYCKRLTLPPQLKVTPDGCDGKLCHGDAVTPACSWKGHEHTTAPTNCSQAGHPAGASAIE